MINNTSLYSQTFSRKYPGLFVILLDQSDSMSQTIVNDGQTKASLVTYYVNMIIQQMIDLAPTNRDGTKRNYAYLSVIGYNDTVSSLLAANYVPVEVPALWNHALGEIPIKRNILDSKGQVVDHIVEYKPYWIIPTHQGETDMANAFEVAEQVVQRWLKSPSEDTIIDGVKRKQAPRDECFPPIVINITDAKDNGARNPIKAVEQIQKLGTKEGNVLVYNCHVTHEGYNPCVFPSTLEEVRQKCKEEVAESMFKMSSKIPEELRKNAQLVMERPIDPDARCFVFNANPDILIKFLKWSTFRTVGGIR